MAPTTAERGPAQDAGPPDRRRWLDTIRSVQIRTARFSNRNVATCGLVPVRITRWPPRFKLAYKPIVVLDLAPEAWMLKVAKEPNGRLKFMRAFDQQLAKINAVDMGERLASICGEGPGLVLLCFEDLRVQGNYCHRQMVATWLSKMYGIDESELPE